MNGADWEDVKRTFAEASDLPRTGRASYLGALNENLRIKVEKLLAAEEAAGDFIVDAAIVNVGLTGNDLPDAFAGRQIDSYKLVKQIGQGGMGAVYLASRSDESFDKQVAIKLIKRGMDTNAVLKRFVMERQILANLEHANIASLLDGGSTEDGLPYLVMEYVEGVPVTKYCYVHNLDTRERLFLFQMICSAVSYAHTNLVVHRDIKPSNILVTEDGTPKLLDFGIAKLLHPDWSVDSADATETMFHVMTPEYASPEQIRGLPVSTASDVYSLGVVLYEMLTGERPYKIESRSPEEIAKIVLTGEPVRPSSVISRPDRDRVGRTDETEVIKTADEKSRAKARPLPDSRSLKGDLDNIILKALRKEPERRYATVQEFSEDIRRYLSGLPVTATADSTSYRLSKFVKRHRTGVAASLLVSLTLIAATAVTGWQAVAARRERDRAEQRFDEVRKLTRTIVLEYYDQIIKLPGSTPLLAKMVQDTLQSLDTLASESSDNADLQSEIATAYQKIGDVQGNPYQGNLGNIDGAIESYQKSLAIREKLVANRPMDPELRRGLAKSYESNGDMLWVIGKYDRAHDNYTKSFHIHDELSKAEPGNTEEAYEVARARHRIGQALSRTGEIDAALESFRLGEEKFRESIEKAPAVGKYKRGLGSAQLKIGDIAVAKNDLRTALDNHQKALDSWSALSAAEPQKANLKRDVALATDRVALDMKGLGNFSGALKVSMRAVEIQAAIAAGDPQNVQYESELGLYYVNLGGIQSKLKDRVSAEKNVTTGLKILERLAAATPHAIELQRDLGLSHETAGDVYRDHGDPNAAATHYVRSAELLDVGPLRRELRDRLARNYESISLIRKTSGNLAEADEWHRRSVDVLSN